MVKNIRFFKNMEKLASTVALTLAITLMGGCAKSNDVEPEETNYDAIYMTIYNDGERQLEWDKITEEELTNIDQSIIATTEEEDNSLYVASYFAYGYEAATRYESKSEAKQKNPDYAQSTLFSSGYDLGKQDKYLAKAQEEQRQYIAIHQSDEPTADEETEYYPLEDLTVVSFGDTHMLVSGYNKESVKAGNYQDIFGKDVTPYIGQDFTATSLHQLVSKDPDILTDGIHMVAEEYRIIPEITKSQFEQMQMGSKQLTK